jgi:hypothetical protein
MRLGTWLAVIAGAAFALGSISASAQEREEHGRDFDRDHYHAYDHDDRGHDFYRDEHRYAMRDWYIAHRDHLPPGLMERDRLTPELERQIVVQGVLPVELRARFYPCPPELEQHLPPPPPNCAHVLVGGHVILLNRANFQIVDVFHFEL